MDDRTAAPPGHDRHPPQAEPGGPPDAEQRPLGALAITAFLVVTILVFWFGMYVLNLVRT